MVLCLIIFYVTTMGVPWQSSRASGVGGGTTEVQDWNPLLYMFQFMGQ